MYYLFAYKPRKTLNAAEARVFFENYCRLLELLQKKEGQLELLNLAELRAEKVELRRDDQSA
ncbi:MAG: hypothetical protein R3D58_03760 [Saprospiraceae bacterium]